MRDTGERGLRTVRCHDCVHAGPFQDAPTPGIGWCVLFGQVRATNVRRTCDWFGHPITPAGIERVASDLRDSGGMLA